MDNGEVESESSSDDEMPPLEDSSDVKLINLQMELYLILDVLLAYNLKAFNTFGWKILWMTPRSFGWQLDPLGDT
ncbi:hypothetical protein CR513_48182, partial [Mucuna pruriens]